MFILSQKKGERGNVGEGVVELNGKRYPGLCGGPLFGGDLRGKTMGVGKKRGMRGCCYCEKSCLKYRYKEG